jgi:2',3'-cyclic-nucleotide 2'-phosphodiesterase (5'-nucleotidase family)
VPGIDIIVGGHSHTRVDKPLTVGKTIIVQAWEHGKALGVLDLTVEDGKITGYNGRLVDIRPGMCEPDRAVQALVDKYRKKADASLDGPAGRTEVDLDGENVRKRETNLGDLIADIVRGSARADAAIVNGGEIRTGIRKGVIRVRDIYSVLPFDSYVVAVILSGKQIIEALEHGVSTVVSGSGAFPQVSGISFSYDRSAQPGKRIREAGIGGKPIDPGKEYTVATNDFLAAGGDGYTVFADAARSSGGYTVTGGAMKGGKLVYSDASRQLRDVVVEYVKKRKVVAPKVEGRIKEVR